MKNTLRNALVLGAVLAALPLSAQNKYLQSNLVSNVPGTGAFTDSKLINAWGLANAPGGPWFVTATDSGYCLVYDSNGAPYPSGNPIVITVPPATTGLGSPTGVIYNATNDFQLSPGVPSTFVFGTEDGTIAGWNASVDQVHAITKAVKSGAIYKGMTNGTLSGGANVLYAANFSQATVDVYDASFHLISLGGGAFQYPGLPAGYAPFNVQNVGGKIYVAWAKQNRKKTEDVPGAGNGYAAVFTPDGALLLQLEHNSIMNSPWGFAVAPATGFGPFSGLILLTQFAGGVIAGYNPSTGAYVSSMINSSGKLIHIPGIWGIAFGDGGLTGSATSLYFAAGPQLEKNGLFGKFTFAP